MRNLLLALTALIAFPVVGSAATIDVSSTADALVAGDGQCTLREAILNANTDSDTTAGDCASGGGADVVNVSAGTYALTIAGLGLPGLGEEEAAVGDLDIAGDLTLRGAGANVTMIRSDTAYNGVIQILGTATVVAFERLTLAGGKGQPFGGGAIYSPGVTVTLSDCVVTGSGGCYSESCTGAINQSGGALVLRRTAVVENPATAVVVAQAVTRIEDSTISRNMAPLLQSLGYMPQVLPPAVLDDGGTLEVVYSTIADNYSLLPPDRRVTRWPAIAAPSWSTKGSIFSNPQLAGDWGDNCNHYYPPVSGGHNIDSDGSCGLTDPTDLSGVDPLLGALQNNGGPTPTQALLPGSPAIDAIPPADCTWDDDGNPATPEVRLATDQRGMARPQGVGCDIGAVEATVNPGCGLGPELALILPGLVWLRRRSGRCRNAADNVARTRRED